MTLPVLLFTVAAICAPQDAGWNNSETKTFKGESLFGHINGGSELYLEYGFDRLEVQYLRKGSREWTLETYRMESPLAGLGIYLSKCGKESPTPGISERHTASPQQITALKGRVMLVLNNPHGKPEDLKEMAEVVRVALAALPSEPLEDPFKVLPAEGRVPGSCFLARGPLALQTVFTFSEGDPFGRHWMAGADYKDAKGRVFQRMVVTCPDGPAAKAVLATLVSSLDPALKPKEKTAERLTFTDDQGLTGEAQVDGRFLRIQVRLPQ